MAIDRRGITRLTPLPAGAGKMDQQLTRKHAADDPMRSPAADGMDEARMGYHVLDRADPGDPWNANRRGLSEPVREKANTDRGETVPAIVKY